MLLLIGLAGTSAHAAANSVAETALQKAQRLEARLQETDVVRPAPKAQRLTSAGVQATDPRGTAPLDDAITCLARSIYWETKGTATAEQEAVASVITNRVADPHFPDSVCGVIKQGSETGRCQFSWWCDGRPDEVREPDEYVGALDVARRALNATLDDPTEGAVFFLHRNVSLAWTDELVLTHRSREFNFYRLPD
ncbi:cell wall hydrolase [Salinicola avicenniae]|uniref:cell wall hydrolase n=1 Tax=Salinicola avicenniae TaxID=2916836 RepID=UPI002074AAA2|nr:cell wall hydrolase [Salinicola sp. S1-1-8]